MVKASPALASELAKLVDAEEGYAEVYDAATKRTFYVTEQTGPHPCEMPHDEGELLRQLNETRDKVERGEVCTLTTEEILAEARRRTGRS